MCAITFTVLGAVRAWQGEDELRLGPPQQRAVLALLRLRQLAGQAAAEEEPGRAVALYLKALGLCQGRCAGDLAAVREHPAFAAVDREYLALAGQAAEVALEAGLAAQVLPALRQAAEQDPLAEPLRARLMLLLAAAGRQAEALAVYETTRAALAEELGIDPGAELRDAHRRVLRQQVSTARVPEVRPASCRPTWPPSPGGGPRWRGCRRCWRSPPPARC